MKTKQELSQDFSPEFKNIIPDLYFKFREYNEDLFNNNVPEPLIIIKKNILLDPDADLESEGYHMGRCCIESKIIFFIEDLFTMCNSLWSAYGVLLHEMIHLSGIDTHGLRFAKECTRINRLLNSGAIVSVEKCKYWIGPASYGYFTREHKKFTEIQANKAIEWGHKRILLKNVIKMKDTIQFIKSKKTKVLFEELEKSINNYVAFVNNL